MRHKDNGGCALVKDVLDRGKCSDDTLVVGDLAGIGLVERDIEVNSYKDSFVEQVEGG